MRVGVLAMETDLVLPIPAGWVVGALILGVVVVLVAGGVGWVVWRRGRS